MPESKKRGGKKAHNKRVKARNEKMKGKIWEFEMLKRKIYEEAKHRYLDEQNKPTELKIKTDDGYNNS
jgi:hypothetical protein